MGKVFMSEGSLGLDAHVLAALQEKSDYITRPFGDDDFTRAVNNELRETFSMSGSVTYAATGTAANGIALSLITPGRYGAIITPFGSHVHINEYNAQASFTGGAQIVTCPVENGKITVIDIEKLLKKTGNNFTHYTGLSITNATDVGTVYCADELKELVTYAHSKNIRVHLDGSRLPNAAAYLGCELAELTGKTGIDVITISATKAGGFAAEAVLTSRADYTDRQLKIMQKNFGQSQSKEKYAACQFRALMQDDYWISNADTANRNAAYLAQEIAEKTGLVPAYDVQTNFVFYENQQSLTGYLQEQGYDFFVWPGEMLRFGLTWQIDKTDIDQLVHDVKMGHSRAEPVI